MGMSKHPVDQNHGNFPLKMMIIEKPAFHTHHLPRPHPAITPTADDGRSVWVIRGIYLVIMIIAL
jgi:hypothetical protein